MLLHLVRLVIICKHIIASNIVQCFNLNSIPIYDILDRVHVNTVCVEKSVSLYEKLKVNNRGHI